MHLPSPLTRLFGSGVLLLLTAAAAAAYSGCDDSSDNPPVNTGSSTSASGSGGAGQGGTGQGGAGQGGTGGGSVACDPMTAVCPCVDPSECPEVTLCIEGLCLAGCTYSYECGAGKVCANGQCVLSCGTADPCPQAGTMCENGVCVPDPANPACSAQDPCPSGEVCVSGVCSTGCTANADCASGEVCNYGTGACMVDPAVQPPCDLIGDSCPGVNQDCLGDGYCHYACTDVPQCKLFDTRFDYCDQGVCKTEEEVNPQCTLQMPCPSGQDCISNQCY